MSSVEEKRERERRRVVKIRRDRDGRREIWFRNKNRILGITRIGEAIWSPSGAKWVVGGRGGVAGGKGEERERGTRGRGNISIWGGATATEYRGAHYRRQLPSVVLGTSSSSPPSLLGHTREEIALLITRRNILLPALCNIANRGLLRTDWRREIAAAIRDSRHPCGSNHSRGACDERIVSNPLECINIYHIYATLIYS